MKSLTFEKNFLVSPKIKNNKKITTNIWKKLILYIKFKFIWACSLMVEHTAHNGKNVGSNPAEPKNDSNKKVETKIFS